MAKHAKTPVLTEAQQKFVELYLGGMTVTESYRNSRPNGRIPPDNASTEVMGRQVFNTPKVRKIIDAARNEVAQRTQDHLVGKYAATKERLIEELAKIAFTEYSDLHSWDQENGLQGKASADLDPNVKGAIVEVTDTKNKDGTRKIKMKLADKRAALETLAKMIGAFAPEKHDHRLAVNFIIERD